MPAPRTRPTVAVVGTRYADLGIEQHGLRRFDPEWCVGWGGDEGELLQLCGGADVVLAGSRPRFTPDVLARMPACRAIVRYGVGVDSVDLPAARAAGIQVANVPDYCAPEVSDQALALALALLRKLGPSDELVRAGRWELAPLRPLRAFGELTFGVVGLGRIGRALARKVRGVGFRVVGSDPYISPEQATRWHIDLRPFEELLGVSDVVSLHLPLLPSTRHLLNAARLRAMPRGAVLVNTSRGGLVDEDALAEALTSGHLSGAGLDVLEMEPPRTDAPLFSAPNVLFSPHTGWYSESSEIRMREGATAEAARALAGRPLKHPVRAA